MGTKFAPSYANLVMGFLEEKIYEKVEKAFNHNCKMLDIEMWKCFFNDFHFEERSNEDLWIFNNVLNTLQPYIKFIIEFKIHRYLHKITQLHCLSKYILQKQRACTNIWFSKRIIGHASKAMSN